MKSPAKAEERVEDTPSTKNRVSLVVGHFAPLSPTKTCATAEAGSKKGHSYKPLPTEFRHDGFNYRQITRIDNAAIYEQTWCGCSSPSVAYEVIRIRRRPGFWIGARFVEPAEVYPKSEAWGTDGFTCTDKDAAFRKLKGLT